MPDEDGRFRRGQAHRQFAGLVRELGSIVLSSLIVLADRIGDRYRDKYGARCRDPND
jgi:hypothetical protein